MQMEMGTEPAAGLGSQLLWKNQIQSDVGEPSSPKGIPVLGKQIPNG